MASPPLQLVEGQTLPGPGLVLVPGIGPAVGVERREPEARVPSHDAGELEAGVAGGADNGDAVLHPDTSGSSRGTGW